MPLLDLLKPKTRFDYIVVVILAVLSLFLTRVSAEVDKQDQDLSNKADNQTISTMLSQTQALISLQQRQLEVTEAKIALMDTQQTERYLEVRDIAVSNKSNVESIAQSQEDILEQLKELNKNIQALKERK